MISERCNEFGIGNTGTPEVRKFGNEVNKSASVVAIYLSIYLSRSRSIRIRSVELLERRLVLRVITASRDGRKPLCRLGRSMNFSKAV